MQRILRYTTDILAARQEIEGTGGRVLQEFTPSLFEAELPDQVDLSVLQLSEAFAGQGADQDTQMAADAWVARQQRVPGAPLPSEGLDWDTPGYTPPRNPNNDPTLFPNDGSGIALSTGTPTSRYMIGSVAVGLVLVSRDQGAEVMTAAEQAKIIEEVQEGLGWLASAEPRARLSFVYDIQRITVSATPGPDNSIIDSYEKYEQGWRDAALAQMGFAAGRTGYRAYVNQLRNQRQTDWAYVAFFTKYPLNHFAYAIWEKVVMAYDNDNWGVDVINRVFAHESCHIFGADDEYGSCVCGGAHGELGVPNNNCRNCSLPNGQESCLMSSNTLQMCSWSRGQIGWDPQLFPQGAPTPQGGKSRRVTSVAYNDDVTTT